MISAYAPLSKVDSRRPEISPMAAPQPVAQVTASSSRARMKPGAGSVVGAVAALSVVLLSASAALAAAAPCPVQAFADLPFVLNLDLMGSDARQARSACKQECADGSLDACYQVATFLDHGVGGSSEKPRAAALMKTNCEKNHSKSCTALGWMYAFGDGVAEDHGRKLELWRKACGMGEKGACGLLDIAARAAKQYATEHVGVQTSQQRQQTKCSEERSFEDCRRSCDFGQGSSCLVLAGMYEVGKGVDQDVSRSFALMKKGCELGDGKSCVMLGLALSVGQGTDRDPKKAKTAFQQACRLGQESGCTYQDSPPQSLGLLGGQVQ